MSRIKPRHANSSPHFIIILVVNLVVTGVTLVQKINNRASCYVFDANVFKESCLYFHNAPPLFLVAFNSHVIFQYHAI